MSTLEQQEMNIESGIQGGNEAFVEQLSEADNQSKHHLKETILETTANIL